MMHWFLDSSWRVGSCAAQVGPTGFAWRPPGAAATGRGTGCDHLAWKLVLPVGCHVGPV